MWDSDCWNDSIRTNSDRDWHNCTHVYNWEASSFNFFNHRCTATRTGASGRGKDNGINVVGA